MRFIFSTLFKSSIELKVSHVQRVLLFVFYPIFTGCPIIDIHNGAVKLNTAQLWINFFCQQILRKYFPEFGQCIVGNQNKVYFFLGYPVSQPLSMALKSFYNQILRMALSFQEKKNGLVLELLHFSWNRRILVGFAVLHFENILYYFLNKISISKMTHFHFQKLIF